MNQLILSKLAYKSMKNILILLAIFISNILTAQVFEVDTIYKSGEDERRINLVILSDGYQESELPQFIIDATNFSDELFSQRPFLEYKDYFNIYAIKVPSNESGADHPGNGTDVTEPAHPVIDVDNYFGSSFDVASIHRLLVPLNGGAINSVLANNFPLYDQVLILVNTPYYGGSGGQYATTSLDAAANEIAIHELGHSFSNLSDEYWAGDQFAGENLNMTQETDPSLVKWINWMGEEGIGIYQHCCGGNSAQWYRPHENCKMRALGNPFCVVCVENTIEKIHSLVSPIDSFAPEEMSMDLETGTDLEFGLNLIDITPVNTLTTNWVLNGASMNTDVSFVSITEPDLEVGNNTLTVFVEDVTDLQRIDMHTSIHIYSVEWNIDFDVQANIIDAKGVKSELEIIAYPNPVTDMLNVRFNNPFNGAFHASLYTLDGKLMKETSDHSQELLQIDTSDLPAGAYIVKYYLDDVYITSQKIIRK